MYITVVLLEPNRISPLRATTIIRYNHTALDAKYSL